MPVYTVHAPKSAETSPVATDRFVFVRDGFHVWAFIAGPFWLLFHRLWLALLGYLVLSFAGEIGLSMLGIAAGPRMLVMFVIALLMGFEASSLRRWSLSRGKWRQLDVIVADNPEAAERRFFDRWANRRREDSYSTDRGAPPPTRHVAAQPFSRGPEDVIGLFPQPGVTR
jgi:hypothetical protein